MVAAAISIQASANASTSKIDQTKSASSTSPADAGRPGSLRSASSTGSPRPNLEDGSLALLAQFQADKFRQEARFVRLEAKTKALEKIRAKAAAPRESKAEEKAEDDDDNDDDDNQEEILAEAEAWNDLERLAKIDAGLAPSPSPSSYRGVDDDDDDGDGYLSVDEWRQLVTEDFQLSQFWYSTPFAYKLAECIASHLQTLSNQLGRQARVAFLCSPTAFVAFQHRFGVSSTDQTACSKDSSVAGFQSDLRWQSGSNMWMFEIDERFKVAARDGGFVKYDFNTPVKGLAEMRFRIDMVVIDPPFLNERTTTLIAQTVHHILLPPAQTCSAASLPTPSRGGSILLLTGKQIAAFAVRTYPLPGHPDLVRTRLDVQHDGGRLSNEFGAWASWEGGRTFGDAVVQ